MKQALREHGRPCSGHADLVILLGWENWKNLEATDRAIAVMEHLEQFTSLQPRRGRQPKVRLSVVRRERGARR